MRIKRPSKLMREATRQRIAAEKAALLEAQRKRASWPLTELGSDRRMEEKAALDALKDVPSVFYFLEQLGGHRPAWASMRYGAK